MPVNPKIALRRLYETSRKILKNYSENFFYLGIRNHQERVAQVFVDPNVHDISTLMGALTAIENPPTGALKKLIANVRRHLFREIVAAPSHYPDRSVFLSIVRDERPEFFAGLQAVIRVLEDEQRAQVFSTLKDLPIEEREQAFLRFEQAGWGVFRVVVRHCPDAVASLLDVIHRQSAADKAQILSASSEGWNALMIAVRNYPEVVARLLDSIDALDDPDNPAAKAQILSQITPNGWNALMIAVRHHPEAVACLLDLIDTLDDPAAKAQILSQTTRDGWNALMLAVRYRPEVVTRLLGSIDTLDDPAAKARILSQVDQDGWNVSQLAERYAHWVLPRLNAARSALAQQITPASSQSKPSNLNMLQFTMRDNPKFVPGVLATIKTFESDEQKASIFSDCDQDDLNALQYAVIHHFEMVKDFLEIINTFPPEQKARILLHGQEEGKTARELASQLPSEARALVLPAILDAIDKMYSASSELSTSPSSSRVRSMSSTARVLSLSSMAASSVPSSSSDVQEAISADTVEALAQQIREMTGLARWVVERGEVSIFVDNPRQKKAIVDILSDVLEFSLSISSNSRGVTKIVCHKVERELGADLLEDPVAAIGASIDSACSSSVSVFSPELEESDDENVQIFSPELEKSDDEVDQDAQAHVASPKRASR